MRTLTFSRIFGLALFACLRDEAASAAGAPAVSVPDVVVTATRSDAKPFDVPATVSIVTEQQIHDRMSRTLPDALSEVPGVLLQRTSRGQTSPFIRGFTGFRTLMLIDGVRLNNSVFRDGPNQYWTSVDPLTVDRLELVKGPSSVLYGSDAIGGTLNVITRSRDGYEPGAHAGGRVLYRYATGDSSNVVRAEVSANIGSLAGILLGAGYRDFENLTAGAGTGTLSKTGYDELPLDGKLDLWTEDGRLHVTLAGYAFDQDDVERTHATSAAESFRGSQVGTDLERKFDQTHRLFYARTAWSDPGALVDEARLTLSLQRMTESEDRVPSNRRPILQDFTVSTPGVDLQLRSPTPLGVLTYGLDWYHDDVSSSRKNPLDPNPQRRRSPRGVVADDSTYDLLGIYLQDELQPFPWLRLVGGARYTAAWADAKDVDPDLTDHNAIGPVQESWSNVSGSLRGLVALAPWLHLYGGASQGFRAPNLSDLTRFDVARSGEVETPSPDLSPERYVETEVGFKVETERFQGDLAYYRTWIRDQIVRQPTGARTRDGIVVVKSNAGDGWVEGIELAGALDLWWGFSARTGFSWIAGEIDGFPTSSATEERGRVSRLAPTTTTLIGRWTAPEGIGFLEGVAQIMDDAHRISADDARDLQRIPPPGGLPGVSIFSVRAGARVGDHLRITAALENIGNKDYRLLGSGVNENGRSFLIQLDAGF